MPRQDWILCFDSAPRTPHTHTHARTHCSDLTRTHRGTRTTVCVGQCVSECVSECVCVSVCVTSHPATEEQEPLTLLRSTSTSPQGRMEGDRDRDWRRKEWTRARERERGREGERERVLSRLPSVQTTCSGCYWCTVVCTLVRLCREELRGLETTHALSHAPQSAPTVCMRDVEVCLAGLVCVSLTLAACSPLLLLLLCLRPCSGLPLDVKMCGRFRSSYFRQYSLIPVVTVSKAWVLGVDWCSVCVCVVIQMLSAAMVRL